MVVSTPGATTSTLTLSSTNVSMNGYQYQCQITGCNGVPLISNPAAVTIGGQPTINTQPLSDTVCQGATATFATSASNVSGYSWEVNTGGGFQTITAGSTYQNPNTPTLTISNVTAQMSGYLYQCRITFCGGDTVTQSALLYVQSQAAIVTQPQDVEICSDTIVSFAITTSGIATSYQWQISTDGGSTYTNLANDTSNQNVSTASMTVTHATIVNNGNMYRCVVGSCGGSVTSSPAKISLLPAVISDVCA
jgi:predicted secreted protein